MITAKIQLDKMGHGCWLFLEHDDKDEDYAIPLQKDEIEPMMKACQKWLRENNARN